MKFLSTVQLRPKSETAGHLNLNAERVKGKWARREKNVLFFANVLTPLFCVRIPRLAESSQRHLLHPPASASSASLGSTQSGRVGVVMVG